jgi:hypothetical protein
MPIPDALLPSIENFDGLWNEADQKARKERKKLEKKGKHRDESLPAPNAIRPNLFLGSNNSSVDAKVHVISSGDQSKTALIVAEGRNGSVTLDIVSSFGNFVFCAVLFTGNLSTENICSTALAYFRDLRECLRSR